MKIELRTLDSIFPYEKNPRINGNAIEAVMKSLKAFGFRQPIVIDAAGVIIVGHTRYEAAKRLKLTQVPCHVALDMTPEQARAYRIADNKTAELAQWDMNLLPEELKVLDEINFDMDSLGFSEEELKGIMASPDIQEIKIDQEPPPQTWVLIGLPTVRFGEIAETVEKLSQIKGIFCEVSATNDKTN